jgi:UDP-3-O-[3-hydroxymyristoyl] glucosamine N-acyltransferase
MIVKKSFSTISQEIETSFTEKEFLEEADSAIRGAKLRKNKHYDQFSHAEAQAIISVALSAFQQQSLTSEEAKLIIEQKDEMEQRTKFRPIKDDMKAL